MPQQVSQYACPIIQIIVQILQQKSNFRMNNLISLDSPGHLLEISNNSINYLVVCESYEAANQLLQIVLSYNKKQQIQALTQDNIAKISIKNVGSISSIKTEVEKMQLLKSLYTQLESFLRNKQKKEQYEKVLVEGFFYINQTKRKIEFFKIYYPLNQCSNLKRKSLDSLQIFGTLGYLIINNQSLFNYLSIWSKIAFRQQQINPIWKQKSKIDIFLKSLLQKQYPTIKVALHSLQIILQTQNWKIDKNIQFSKQGTINANIENKQKNVIKSNYQDIIKINQNKCNKIETKCRLKHTNSMTSLSSNKSRKYKKVSTHFKETKTSFGNRKQNISTSCSFWNGKNSTYIQPHTLLSTNKSYYETGDKWMKQQLNKSKMIKQNYKDKQINQAKLDTNLIANQSQLIELLQRNQRKRNCITNQNIKISNSYCNQNFLKLQNGTMSQIKPNYSRKQLKICNKIQISIPDEMKNSNFRIISSVIFINERLSEPRIATNSDIITQKQIVKKSKTNQEVVNLQRVDQSKKIAKMQLITNDELIDKPLQSNNTRQQMSINANIKTNSPFDTKKMQIFNQNLTFIGAFVNTFNKKQKIFMKKKIILSYFVLTVYGFILQKKQKVKSGSEYCKKVTEAIQKMSEYYVKFCKDNSQPNQNIQYLLKIDSKDSQNVDSQKLKEVALTILKRQFSLIRQQILRNNKIRTQSSSLVSYVLFELGLAISISIIKEIKQQNPHISNYKQYCERAVCKYSDPQKIPIDLKSQLQEYQNMF